MTFEEWWEQSDHICPPEGQSHILADFLDMKECWDAAYRAGQEGMRERICRGEDIQDDEGYRNETYPLECDDE